MIAQEVLEVLPYSVGTFKAQADRSARTATDFYDFNPSALAFVTVNALKELDVRVASLETGTTGRNRGTVGDTIEGATKADQRTDRDAMSSATDERPEAQGSSIGRPLLQRFGADEAVEIGDVAVIDPIGDGVVRGRTTADRLVVGVVAGPPESANEGTAGAVVVPVAVSGVTLCRADARYGAIKKGDLLVSSPTPGHAMKGEFPIEPGTAIGKALDDLHEGSSLVRILVLLR